MWDNRLKIKQRDYNVLRDSINEVITQNGLEKIKTVRRETKYVKDQFTAFVWVLWRHATDQDFRRELYVYLNDAHVETALKSILEAYKEVR